MDVSVRIYRHRGLDHGIVYRALRDRVGTDMGLPAEAVGQGPHLLGQLSWEQCLQVAEGQASLCLEELAGSLCLTASGETPKPLDNAPTPTNIS